MMAAVLAQQMSWGWGPLGQGIAQHTGRHLLEQTASSPRVLGVGLGVFLLAFFLIICLLLGLLGSRTTKPGLCYALSGGTYGVILLVLLASPRGAPPPPSPVGYDNTIIPLVIMIILMSVAALAALIGLLVFHARAAIYARPLNYHADVLHQQ